MTFSIEINQIDISPNIWWLDTGSHIHITNSLQSFLGRRAPRKNEQHICVGNDQRVVVKSIGLVRLDLRSSVFYDLDNVYFVPSMRRSLVYVSLLVKTGCSFLIDNYGIKISLHYDYLGFGIFVDDYKCCVLIPNKKFSFRKLKNLTGVKRKISENLVFFFA